MAIFCIWFFFLAPRESKFVDDFADESSYKPAELAYFQKSFILIKVDSHLSMAVGSWFQFGSIFALFMGLFLPWTLSALNLAFG